MTTHSCHYSDKAVNLMIITLIGFMASGKSSVGKKLSALLSCNFIDLDSYIEDKYGKSIKEIFASEGEDGFRTKEEDSLSDLLINKKSWEDKRLTIIATGGGIVTREKCRILLQKIAYSIYLKTEAKTIEKRLLRQGKLEKRPILSQQVPTRDCINDLLQKRKALYEEVADVTIATDSLTINEVAKKCYQIISSLS